MGLLDRHVADFNVADRGRAPVLVRRSSGSLHRVRSSSRAKPASSSSSESTMATVSAEAKWSDGIAANGLAPSSWSPGDRTGLVPEPSRDINHHPAHGPGPSERGSPRPTMAEP